MTDLVFKLDGWDCGSLPKELSVTYTKLLIRVGETTVSRINDRGANSVSDTIYLPAYPLAAWIAANWWRLLYDCNNLRDNNEYEYTHNLKFAGEGYFLPDMLIAPDGANMAALSWHPCVMNNEMLAFIETGCAHIGIGNLQAALSSVVNAVVVRLRERGISGTTLQQDWDAICSSTSDKDEHAFCIACARLGKDPYDIDDALAETIIDIHRRLDNKVHLEEILSSTNGLRLREASETLCELLNGGSQGSIDATLAELRDGCAKTISGTPWETGYAQAKVARQILNHHGMTVGDLRELTSANTHDADIPDSLLSLASPCGFITGKSTNLSSFVLGRMLGAFICSANKAMPITEVYTAEQKRQRAFSAELYVPGEELKRRFEHTSTIGEDTVIEIAEEYGINPLVVKHQLENHHIAKVV
ncbi:MAG: hypothetical protein IJS01_07005 [Lentisphaeria bacterium]|nr:hypothetical protein [Lentisphaeria bacterium]